MKSRDLTQAALNAAIAADNVTLNRKADVASIRDLADRMEREFLPALRETWQQDEWDVCILWLGMRRRATDFIPDVEAAVALLRSEDWVPIRELGVALSRAALQHEHRDRAYRRLLAA
jgi:hypothetical protein